MKVTNAQHAIFQQCLTKIHFKTHRDRNQAKCDVCGVFVRDVKDHKDRVHAKCSACKQIFVDLQQLKNHEPDCSHMKDEIELQTSRRLFRKIWHH